MSKFKFEKQFRAENPQTIGEADRHFDLYNYKDWLEEKIRWIPVEEENPPVDKHLNEDTFKYSITVEVKNDIKIQSAYFNTETGQWRSLITGCIINPTHWRRFL